MVIDQSEKQKLGDRNPLAMACLFIICYLLICYLFGLLICYVKNCDKGGGLEGLERYKGDETPL